jgi:hypothetical protein
MVRVLGENPVLMPLCTPKISHALAWYRIRTSVVGVWPTVWVTTRPTSTDKKIVYNTHRDSASHRERCALSLERHFGENCETKQSLCGLYRYNTWTICRILIYKPGGSFGTHCAVMWLSTTPLEVWETGGTAPASRSGRFTLEGRDVVLRDKKLGDTHCRYGHGGKEKRIPTFVPSGNQTLIIHSAHSTHGQSRTSSLNSIRCTFRSCRQFHWHRNADADVTWWTTHLGVKPRSHFEVIIKSAANVTDRYRKIRVLLTGTQLLKFRRNAVRTKRR